MINTIQYLYTKDQQIFGELKYSDTLFSKYKKHFHTHFGLALITYGELEITYDAGTIRHLDNHAIALFNPLQVHQSKALNATGYYVLFLDKQWCKTVHEHFYISDNIVKDKHLYQSFKALFRTILAEQEHVTESVVSQTMQDFFQKYGSVYIPKASSTMIQIKKIIEEKSDTSFSVEQLAKELGYDKSYLIRMFKKEVDLTPQQYILNIKVNRAKDLLTYTQGKSLSSISVDAGFLTKAI